MGQYAVKRVLLFIPTLVIVTMIVYALFWVIPGDAATVMLTGEAGDVAQVDVEDIKRLRHKLGLDRPLYIQYGDWLGKMVRGDLGDSIWYSSPVVDELIQKFPITFELAVMAIVMAFLVAVPLGVVSAVKQDTWLDYSTRIFTFMGIALPTFWIGILIVNALAYSVEWLPPLGYANLWDDPWINLQQMSLPALALAFHDLAFAARVCRSSMLEVLREDYIRTARSKGLKEAVVLGRHAVKNALLPVLTISGYQFGRLLGGTIIIESIFVVPGMGRFLILSIIHRDFVVIQAIVLLTSVVVLALNLIIDLVYGLLDPRIRYN